jgi:hypothetical protein
MKSAVAARMTKAPPDLTLGGVSATYKGACALRAGGTFDAREVTTFVGLSEEFQWESRISFWTA